ncbi:MAG: hypothetical protein MJ094_04900 [Saccharofermentans sp.]|nr:hypothetical protein [Saccharofermentans sp.]
MNRKSIVVPIFVIFAIIFIFGSFIIFNRIRVTQAFDTLKVEENCATVSNYSQQEILFLNRVEAFYMQLCNLKNVSITGSSFTFEAPNWDCVNNNESVKREFLGLYLEYLCETYPIPSSEYLSIYATDESYIDFLGSKSDAIAYVMENAICEATPTNYEVVSNGDAIVSIHNNLFKGFDFVNQGVDIESLAVLMDELIANGDLVITHIANSTYQTSINLTDSLLNELELYGDGLTSGFVGDVEATIDLNIDDENFELLIDEYAIIMSKFNYIEANGYQLIINFTGLNNAEMEELEAYAIRMEYEGYEDMLNSVIHTIEGAIGNGYYDTRVISGTYEFDGVNVIFHTDDGIMYGVYNDGVILMNLTVDGVERELVFE